MTHPSRRAVLVAAGGLLASRAIGDGTAGPSPSPTRMGLVVHSYGIRRFDDPLAFLEHARGLGAGGVQTTLRVPDDRACEAILAFTRAHGLYLEGIVSLPRDEADVPRFAAEVRAARRCGADVFRTVLMPGRRYEVFASMEAFRRFREQAERSLALARPAVESHEMRMAVENHKDLEAGDLVALIRRLDSPLIGVCLDTGNNLALLEDPRDTVALLAPLTLSTHLKDMGVAPDADGFLLAEVPLGSGVLDLPAIIAAVRAARPEARWNLEMITRDPLRVPCLTPGYWATLGHVAAPRLAALLALARDRASASPLPRIGDLPREEQVRREEENVRESLRHAPGLLARGD